LPVIIDSQHEFRTRRKPRLLLAIAAILAAFLIAIWVSLSYWVDLLWFRSLGYDQVFWTNLRVQGFTFAAFSIATFLLLFVAFTVLRRMYQDSFPSDHQLLLAGQPINLSVAPTLRVLSLIISLVVAFISGATMASDWQILALSWYAPHSAGNISDPIFGKPLPFFLFTLPAMQLVLGWLTTVAVIACIAALLVALIAGGTQAFDKRRTTLGLSPWRGVSFAAVPLLLLLAVNVYLSRFQCLLDHHTIFDGINYTDAHVTLAGLLVVSVALALGAVFVAFNAFRQPSGRTLAVAIAPAVGCYLLLGVVSWYVSNFVVKPNELVREEPYIAHNIDMTRKAFGLDQFTQREFPAETSPEAADPAANQPTLQNIRLWDWHALQDTLSQVQEIRTYYEFPDIDIDRYQINGSVREVMLAARELNVNKLPVSSQNWINEKLVYTHGYGITMNPVNEFTSEGLPDLLLSNMPVQSTVPGLAVTRPEIYFGELTNTDVYVKTKQQEFDYPQGATNSLTSYQGNGGVVLGGFLNRLVIAFDRNDLGKLPFSDDVTSQSRLLMRRNVRERAATLAPFLSFDQDPYMVLSDDGRLYWIMDAFTTSDSYPYSTHYALDDNSINYMRNSVKVVVDAYNGTTTFYTFDKNDPILGTYSRIFPTLFKDASLMPADLRKHIRYPEKLFKLQAEVYGLYHMTSPEVFFNREDLWTIATETGTDSNGQQASQPIEPNFVLMKLPGERDVEFVEILPFTPANRNNLIGWIAGRCDGSQYGTSIVYNFPKTRLVDGPQQIESRIDQNAQLSGQLTLWNQQGSHVLRGSLLVIPTGKALLYAEPIYLQAQQSPMPELRLVVLALQDRLAYGPTFADALNSLFGGGTSGLTATEASQPSASSAAPAGGKPQRAEDLNGLIAEAGRDFADYQHLTAAGKLGEAGQKLDQLKVVLDRLNAEKK
jgi:uncharacterized membrane protein (UPF0182 family)